MGFARLAESSLRKIRGKDEKEKLGALDKIVASSIGGALATWNQPIEVVRVEVNQRLNYHVLFSNVLCIFRCSQCRKIPQQTDRQNSLSSILLDTFTKKMALRVCTVV